MPTWTVKVAQTDINRWFKTNYLPMFHPRKIQASGAIRGFWSRR